MEVRSISRMTLGLVVGVVLGCSPSADRPTSEGGTEGQVDHLEADEMPHSGRSTRPDLIILISIDTLRADHLGVYGYERFTSPQLDGFAAQGVVFEDASSTAPWTLPSHASLLTGLHPAAHGVRTQRSPLPDDVPTLAGFLAEAGWQTAAVVNSTWLKRETFGVTRDFVEYKWVEDLKDKRTPTTWVTDQAITWLRELSGAPLFLFVHYYDVHADYASQPEYERLFVTPYEGHADGTTWQLQLANLEDEYIELCHRAFDPKKCNFGTAEEPLWVNASVEKVVFDAADVRHLEALYDGGIRQLDTELGRFFRFLDEEGLSERSLVVVTSDHGEEFHDHGRVDHFLTQYQEMLHVPLLVRGPGIPPGLRVSTPVSIIDIAPTILARAGISPPGSLEGIDLAPLWRGDVSPIFDERFLYGEAPGGLNWEHVVTGIAPVYRSVRRGPSKLVEAVENGQRRHALYDLASDPAERVDVSGQNSDQAAALLAELRSREAAIAGSGEPGATAPLDPEEAARLRALGYMVP